ncbi:hypothetical protein C7M84_016658 [Penaeus vannamei]|uniref:Uncharacterized protein n=1 Tax=Penaeus vannamei TaxID=6689 RepID=A0A423SM97_PENVA|nr:uncharacterized protein LOC113820222 [Penaeus vannamei]ROT65378.1 hypothetical protein C7M84_016658 [Penaeus vannamei]
MEFTTVSTASAIATTLTTKSYDYFDPTVFPGPDDDLDDIDDRWPTWVSLMPGVALLSLTLAVVWFVASRPGARRIRLCNRRVEPNSSTPLLHHCDHLQACDCEAELVRYCKCPV